ncbi:ADP-ribosylglycohydrolase family protein [Spirillospora sp. NPDC029432]|uniref:ADP-ribosylglycohydrolase family protein n=1 Tax=Spirillospora sp. NPDC029432 TaxID=3154599 RepID=UPI003452C54C
MNEVASRARAVFVASAVGDALGWPHERRDRVLDTAPSADGMGPGIFFSWTRKAGSRFQPVYEEISAGEYSDDTQLIIATARARLTPDGHWVKQLTDIELPFFLQYERGAGASVKRSCRAWTRRTAPWVASKDDPAKYFAAGANGVAMRIAPHVLLHHADDNFGLLASDVTRDAILTHGHPRALVGALAYAYALWMSLRQAPSIRYGWLIETLLADAKSWSALHEAVLDTHWLRLADQHHAGDYRGAWAKSVEEVIRMLEQATEALALGAVGTPRSFANRIGGTATKTNGSGTITAVLAAFLAAWGSADPLRALQTAATLKGADTDTLASMTGGLLGAALGGDWINSAAREVQDAILLQRLATELVDSDHRSKNQMSLPLEFSRPTTTELTKAVPELRAGQDITLPNGCRAQVGDIVQLRAKAHSVQRLRVQTEDGQTLYFIHTDSQQNRAASTASPHIPPPSQRETIPAILEPTLNSRDLTSELAGIEIQAANLHKTRFTLERIIGVRPLESGDGWVRYRGLFVAQGTSRQSIDPSVVRIRIRSRHFDAIESRAVAAGLTPRRLPRNEEEAFEIKIAPGVLALVTRQQHDVPPIIK